MSDSDHREISLETIKFWAHEILGVKASLGTLSLVLEKKTLTEEQIACMKTVCDLANEKLESIAQLITQSE